MTDYPNGIVQAPEDIHDVTHLNTWMNKVPDGSVIELPDVMVYTSDDTLRLQGRNAVHLNGRGSTFVRKLASRSDQSASANRTWSHFESKYGSEISIQSLYFDGDNELTTYNSTYEAQHGVSVQGTQGFEAEDIFVTSVRGDGFCLAPSNGARSNEVHFKNCHFSELGRQGWSFTGCEKVWIEECSLGNMARSVMDFEPLVSNLTDPSWGAKDVEIDHCEFHTGGSYWLAGEGIGQIENLHIHDCELIGRAMTMKIAEQTRPVPQRRGPIFLINNHSDTQASMGISPFYIRWTDNLMIAGNVQPMNPARGMTAVYTPGCTEVKVFWNSFVGAAAVMIDPASATTCAENRTVQGGPYDQPK